jgi:TolB protein
MSKKLWPVLGGIILAVFALMVSGVHAQGGTGQLAFVVFKDGQWDIFSIAADGSNLRQLTQDTLAEDHPAYSPDGRYVAYSARSATGQQGANNWDVYLLDLTSGAQRRLTNHADYDGAPAWHPSGTKLAFESYRNGDLDIWLLDLNDETLVNLTAESTADEFHPAWHPDGQRLYFASWRGGNTDIWQIDLATQSLTQLTNDPMADSFPVWNQQQQTLAFRRNILGDYDLFMRAEASETITQISWLGSVGQVAFGEDGQTMVGIYQGYQGAQVVLMEPGNPVPQALTQPLLLRETLSWHPGPTLAGTAIATLESQFNPLYTEIVRPSTSTLGEPHDLIRINDLQTGSPWLADTVDDSYQALRLRLAAEVGYDFLGQVSETWRPADFFSDASQYASWHKSGRAFDTVFDWPDGAMQIVRQNIGGETYWRILLRCVDQSGACGRPSVAKPWNYSARARTVLAPEQGGVEAANLQGYYLDFTELAQQYGWTRIASYDDEEFSWTWHFKAFEYWHYQKTAASSKMHSGWYQAMRDVYPPAEIETYFTWDIMRAIEQDPYEIVIKGVPAPPSAQRWWQQLVIQ